jgi:hypothetical protein
MGLGLGTRSKDRVLTTGLTETSIRVNGKMISVLERAATSGKMETVTKAVG